MRQFVPATHQQALEAQARGEAALTAQDYEHAVVNYEQARELYEQGAREAEDIRQQQAAELVRQQQLRAEAARGAARQAREAAQALFPWARASWEQAR